MSRYIDADALVIDYYDDYEAKDDIYTYAYVSQFQIDSAPSIDIVRCKDCKWDKARMMPRDIKCIYEHEPDDFCSYGERSDQ